MTLNSLKWDIEKTGEYSFSVKPRKWYIWYVFSKQLMILVIKLIIGKTNG